MLYSILLLLQTEFCDVNCEFGILLSKHLYSTVKPFHNLGSKNFIFKTILLVLTCRLAALAMTQNFFETIF